jgi:2-polyprenyl-3-methyl-5-hydroxy-6-metoxy-1,4-benzoquinol methylase
MTALEGWVTRVEAHHEQSRRIQERSAWAPDESGRYVAGMFVADPRRTDDLVLNRLLHAVSPATTVLDVGGGAGRYALPLALACNHVTVIEPDPGMVRALREQMARHRIANITVVEDTWQAARVEPADVVLCAHVIYDVVAIQDFVRWLTVHARERVLLVATMPWRMSMLSAFWPRIHGEERITLPSVPELLPLLWELGVFPNLEMLSLHRPEPFGDRDQALTLLRRMIYVKPGGEQDARLQSALDALTCEVPGGIALRDALPHRQAVVSWSDE